LHQIKHRVVGWQEGNIRRSFQTLTNRVNGKVNVWNDLGCARLSLLIRNGMALAHEIYDVLFCREESEPIDDIHERIMLRCHEPIRGVSQEWHKRWANRCVAIDTASRSPQSRCRRKRQRYRLLGARVSFVPTCGPR